MHAKLPNTACGGGGGGGGNARFLLIALLIGVALAATVTTTIQPPQAQAQDVQSNVLVSNIGQSAESTRAQALYIYDIATPFTTGSNSGGYSLASIEMKLREFHELNADQRSALKAELWSDYNGLPCAKIFDFTVPNTSSGTGSLGDLNFENRDISFTAPSGSKVEANTTYYFVLQRDSLEPGPGVAVTNTNSASLDSGSLSGWSIGNRLSRPQAQNYWHNLSGSNRSLMRVSGTASSAGTASTLDLATCHRGDTFSEGDGHLTVMARLDEPAGSGGVEVSLSASGTASNFADYVLPAPFTIPAGKLSATSTITINDDPDVESDETIILAVTGGALTVSGVTVTITDNDSAGAEVSETTRSVAEGETTNYTVVLTSRPSSTVTITPRSANDAVAQVEGSPLSFDSSGWNTPQTVTISGAKKGDALIDHAIDSEDLQYAYIAVEQVAVTVTEAPSTGESPVEPQRDPVSPGRPSVGPVSPPPPVTTTAPDESQEPDEEEPQESEEEEMQPPEVDPACSPLFTDVEPTNTHYKNINKICALKITVGCSTEPRKYCPNDPVTRAEMASFLVRALKLKTVDQSASFIDVDPESSHYGDINTLYANKITVGCSTEPRKYCPNDPVTRAEMASFLVRALKLKTVDQSAGFVDVDPESSHYGNINSLYTNGITVGCATAPRRYCPNGPVTRAEMASFLVRGFKL
ncbi:MAG: S-layer homology domain-containing protein [Acidimicrobiia bacterium]|nr:S-layer homology domain-containing protein [Acidimicrobiia bacterium]